MSDITAEGTDDQPASQLTMVDIAYESIVSGIVTRRYAGGEILQEAKLALALGLSRTPVREALGRLEGEGLLTRSGRVLMVRSVTVKEYLEALALRRLLEGEAIALACGGVSPEVLVDLKTRVTALRDPKDISADQHWQLDDDIHLTIARSSGNDLMASMIADLRLKTRLFNLKKVPDRFLPGRDEHLAILDALISQNKDDARAAMLNHLDNVKKGILGALGF
jgi:DNA-binding GntR family transcriptional regulator